MSASPLSNSWHPGRRKSRPPKNYNRIRTLLMLMPTRGIATEHDLARAAGISASQLNRIVRGECTPSFAVMAALTKALEVHLGRTLDPRDILNFDGDYPTRSPNQLLGLPAEDA